MTIHYKNPRRPKMTICGHDCTISGRTYSNITNKLYQVNCKACLNAIRNNKLMIERYSEEYIDAWMNKK